VLTCVLFSSTIRGNELLLFAQIHVKNPRPSSLIALFFFWPLSQCEFEWSDSHQRYGRMFQCMAHLFPSSPSFVTRVSYDLTPAVRIVYRYPPFAPSTGRTTIELSWSMPSFFVTKICEQCRLCLRWVVSCSFFFTPPPLPAR